MLLGRILQRTKHSDVALVDTLLGIAHHKFNGKTHRQPSGGLMENTGLLRLCARAFTVCRQQAKYRHESHRSKISMMLLQPSRKWSNLIADS